MRTIRNSVGAMRYHTIRRAQSIRARLSMVFLFLFLLVIVLGIESLRSLSYVNDASAQIRTRWLPSTRALGDLNNLTTDFPAAEIAVLRAESAGEQFSALRQIADLERGVAAAQHAYQQIHHDAAEDELYRRFEAQWLRYRNLAAHDRVISSGAAGAGTHPQGQTSLAAYDAAS